MYHYYIKKYTSISMNWTLKIELLVQVYITNTKKTVWGTKGNIKKKDFIFKV